MTISSQETDFTRAAELIWSKLENSPVWLLVGKDFELVAFEDSDHFCFCDAGVSLLFDRVEEELLLTSIVIHVEGTEPDEDDPGYQPFKGILPAGLKAGMTREEVVALLGEPSGVGRARMDPVLGRILPHIKYYPKSDVQIFIEFDNGMIENVHVGKAFY